MTEAICTLKDNRKLSYAVYGPEDGKPVLYFHGTPSSRREVQILDAYGIDAEALLAQAGIRLIAPDRHALSTFYPQRSFLSFAEDALQLLQHLNISRCPVLCWSGGGPYALAMAHRYPEVIEGVYMLCAFTRRFDRDVLQQMGLNKWYFLSARYIPLLLQLGMNFIRRRKTTTLPRQQFTGLPYKDYILLKKRIREVAGLTLKEATRKGARSAVQEAAAYFHEFGFSVTGIQQPIHYWWGTDDMSVSEPHPRTIEQQAPNAIMHYRQNEGHLSVYLNCFGEALQAIALAQTTQEAYSLPPTEKSSGTF